MIATDESTVAAKPVFNAIVVEDGESDRCFPDPTWTDESNWNEMLRVTDDLPNQLVTSEEDPRWRGRIFSGYTSAISDRWSLVTGNTDPSSFGLDPTA